MISYSKGVMKKVALFILVTFTLVTGLYSIYNIIYSGKIYPGITIANADISGTIPADSKFKLIQHIAMPTEITLSFQSQAFNIPTSSVKFGYDLDKTVEAAYRFGRSGNVAVDIKNSIAAPFLKPNYPLRFNLDQEKLNDLLSTIAEQVTVEPASPYVELTDTGKIIVNRGKTGTSIDKAKIEKEILENFSRNTFSPIVISTIEVDPTINEQQAKVLEQRAQKVLGKNVALTSDNYKLKITDKEIISRLNENGFDQEKILQKVAEVSRALNQQPQNPVFIEENGKVKEFTPSKNGVSVLSEILAKDILAAFKLLEASEEKIANINVSVEIAEPAIKTEDINNLGIKELLGIGTSTFKGSIPGRIHNIELAASRLNGVLIAPGETFSFNEALGDVSRYTGYQSAYVIKDGKTILGDGGGVCQVSTTFFRAALDSGLPIVERRAHSYRVYYYEQDSGPGLDATVYAPTTDLKIQNDTLGHILIQSSTDTKNLALRFEFYGTSDGRVATTTKPVILNSIAPPEDLYQDDPTLASGVVKQTEHKAWGAKVIFDYSVERNGENIYKKQFVSNYRPWQAIFLVGTKEG